MRKVLLSLTLLLVASFSFAQVKAVKEAKKLAMAMTPNFAQAEELINGALENAETKDQAATWDVAGFIQKKINEAEMQKAWLQQPFDTIKAYNSVLKMFEYFQKCDELAQVPNEKGKIKNKFRKRNAAVMLGDRPNLINGGIIFFNEKSDSKQAVKYFGTYVESAYYPMMEEHNLAVNDTLIPQIAFYASLAANSADDKKSVAKYAKIAIADKENGASAMQLYCEALKGLEKTEEWVESLKEGILKFPENQYFFANLIDYYSSNNESAKAMQFADDMLAQDPNNVLYLYVKAYLYHNLKEYDNAIVFYEKAIAVDPTYAEAYSNLGLVLLLQAQDIADNSTTDITDPKYSEIQTKLKAYYEKALPYYEKARELKPENQTLWAPGLYRIYYNLNMGDKFEEIEMLMK